MVKKLQLNAETRSEAKGKINDLRNAGFIPAVLYGQGKEATSLMFKRGELEKAFKEAGESTLVDVVIDGKDAAKAVFKDVQRDPRLNGIIHADLYRVDMKQKLEVEVTLNFLGESRMVKELGGTLVINMESIKVKCLPGDLLDKIDVDVSKIASEDDYIKIKDLSVPETVEIIGNDDDIIAQVTLPVEEAEPVVKEESAAPAEAPAEENSGAAKAGAAKEKK